MPSMHWWCFDGILLQLNESTTTTKKTVFSAISFIKWALSKILWINLHTFLRPLKGIFFIRATITVCCFAMACFSWTWLYSCYSSETLTAVACSEGLQGRPQNTKTAKCWIPPMNEQKAQSHRMIVKQLIMAQCTNWGFVESKYLDHSSHGVHVNRPLQFSLIRNQ